MAKQFHSKKKRSNDPSYKKMKADYFPVQRNFDVASSGSVVGSLQLVDVGLSLSEVNHRLYRQGKTYQVKVDLKPTEETAVGAYEIYALVDTWYVQKAWQLAFQTYQDVTADERAYLSDQKIARWEDFRVTSGMTGIHQTGPYRYDDTNLAGAYQVTGEHLASEITLADGSTQRTFTWGPTTGSSLGLIEEYDKAGNTDLSPSTLAAANPYAGAMDGVHESQADDLAARGNEPPYDDETFGTNYWVKIGELVTRPTGVQRTTTGFFNAPCGMVVIRTPTPNQTLTNELTVSVRAGNYKGVSAMNMG